MIGREREMEALGAFYDNTQTNILTVLGRSGMGKTCLLKEFTRNKQCLYYTAYSTTDQQQRALFAKSAGIATGEEVDIPQLSDILEKVTEMSAEGRVVLVIDHYCDFAKSDDSYQNVLHEFMTEKWERGRVKLIMCDSSYLQMEKLVNSPKSIWKDMSPITVELNQISFTDSAKFLDGAEPLLAAEVFGITGGIPVLLELANEEIAKGYDRKDTVWKIIERIFLSKFFGFKGAAESILNKELREKAYYDRLMYALANGCQRVNQLSEKLGRPKDVVVPYLTTLMKLGLVKKENPVTEPTNRRKTRYSLVSDHDRFWYQVIVGRYDEYSIGDTESIREYWEENRDAFMKPVFTRICREYLKRQSDENRLPFIINNVGNWWENDETTGTSVDFDLMATGEAEGKSAYAFGRCFFQEKEVDMLDVKELIDLTKKIHNKVTTFYLFFSVSGFAENVRTVSHTIRNIMLIELKDML